MIPSALDELKVESVLSSIVLEDGVQQDVRDKLELFLAKLTESARLVEMQCNINDSFK